MYPKLNSLLTLYARKGAFKSLRQSAFRKFCRHNKGQTMLIDCVDQFRMEVVIGDSVDNKIAVYREYEPSTGYIIRHLAPLSSAFVDVGCNIGYFSCLYGTYKNSSLIVSIDPNPEMTKRTVINLEKNGLNAGITVNCGIGEKPGKIDLHIPSYRHSLASLAYVPNRGGETRSIEVPVITLDQIAYEHSIQNAILKIDTEGFESRVMQGLTPKYLNSFSYIVCEMSAPHLKSAGQSIEQMLSMPIMKNMRCFLISDEHTPKLFEVSSEEITSRPTFNENVLFIPEHTKMPQPLTHLLN